LVPLRIERDEPLDTLLVVRRGDAFRGGEHTFGLQKHGFRFGESVEAHQRLPQPHAADAHLPVVLAKRPFG
jgi:hypothetical protein